MRGCPLIPAGLLPVYLRAVMFTTASFTVLSLLPIAAKMGAHRSLEGPADPGVESRVLPLLGWSRRWCGPTRWCCSSGHRSIRSTCGALGAKVGRGVAVFSRNVPVCTDLLTLGDGAVIRTASSFACYRAHSGVIQTGPVTIGKDAVLGEASVLDIDTFLGQSAQLGHASSLHPGQNGGPTANAGTAPPAAGPGWTSGRCRPPSAAARAGWPTASGSC